MTEWALDRIDIEGFLSIRSASVQLGRLNVLVGANGAGKSNFIRALELLGRIADGELGLFVGLNGGASTLLHEAASEVVLRTRTADVEYDLALWPAANDELIFGSEFVRDVATGRASGLGAGHRESEARTPAMLALRGVRVFHFHDTGRRSPIKQFAPTADNLTLRNDGGNLAAVLMDLQAGDGPAYRRIVGAIKHVAPFFRDFVLRPEGNEMVRLRWRQTGSDAVFSADQMSDGTLRFICLATLLLQPELPGLVVLDEPELGLHPFAIVQLAELLRQASVRGQVLFATQSVTLLGQFELSDLIVAERRDGASRFHRPDPESLAQWLDEYSLGDLWEKNLLGGGPTREDVDG